MNMLPFTISLTLHDLDFVILSNCESFLHIERKLITRTQAVAVSMSHKVRRFFLVLFFLCYKMNKLHNSTHETSAVFACVRRHRPRRNEATGIFQECLS